MKRGTVTLKLSPAMEAVLTTAYRNATAPIVARTNTVAALVDRKLVSAGSENFLTDDGLRAAERLLGLPISGHSVHVDDATMADDIAEVDAMDAPSIANTGAPRLRVGDVVQYRKVGRAILLSRASDFVGSDHEDWHVRFLTGPRRYREAPRYTVWVSVADRVESARDPRESMIHIGTWRQSCASVGCDGCPQSKGTTMADTDTYDPRDEITDEQAGADTWVIDQINHDAVRAEMEAEYAAELEAELEAERAEMAHAVMESQDAPEYVNTGPAPVMSTGRGAWHGEHRKPVSVKSREAAKRRRKAQRQARKAQRRAGR